MSVSVSMFLCFNLTFPYISHSFPIPEGSSLCHGPIRNQAPKSGNALSVRAFARDAKCQHTLHVSVQRESLCHDDSGLRDPGQSPDRWETSIFHHMGHGTWTRTGGYTDQETETKEKKENESGM